MSAPATSRLLDLSGQVALVTGGGGGLGRAVARRLAEAGADVAVHYRSSDESARAVAEEVRAAGRRSLTVAADLTREAEVERAVEEAEAELGGLDILINNAGIFPLAELGAIDEAEWRRVVGANLDSVHLCTRAAAAAMRRRGGGAIVNVASIEATSGGSLHSHYAAAKAGVVAYTRSAALELGPRGIRVNAVSPGLIYRPGLEEAWPEGVEKWRREAPLGRVGGPVEVADACLFLASPAARWITGAELTVDGGYLCRSLV